MNESYKLVKEAIDKLGNKVEEEDGDTIIVTDRGFFLEQIKQQTI